MSRYRMRLRLAIVAVVTGMAVVGIAREKPADTVLVGKTPFAAVIVAADNSLPPARLLSQRIGKITGQKPLAVAKDGGEIANAEDILTIHVGRTKYVESLQLELDSLDPSGYRIYLRDGKNLVVAGRFRKGTDYAATDLLKRYAGYRHFQGLEEILPQSEFLKLPSQLDIVEEPSFTTYYNAGFYGGNGAFSRSSRISMYATHWFSRIFPVEKYGGSHPEYYPMIDGKRYVPKPNVRGTWQPCVSNPDLPAIAIDFAREYFADNPDKLAVPMGVNDGGGNCQCPDCLALKEKYGNQYIPFYNAVARQIHKEFPDKYVAFIAYGGASAAPHGIKLEPGIHVEITSGIRDNLSIMAAWNAAGASSLGHYGYFYGGGYVVPRHYPRTMGEAWRTAVRKYDLKGGWFETFTQVPLYDGPRQYVLNELAWNIDADIGALLEDYFKNVYGPGGAAVQRVFERHEAVYRRRADPLHPMNDRGTPAQMADYTRRDLAYMRRNLASAAKAVARADDAVASRHLELLAKVHGLSERMIELEITLKELEKIRAVSGWRLEKLVAKMGEAFRLQAEIEEYSMTEEEEKAIFIRTTLDKYRTQPRLQAGSRLEEIADDLVEAEVAELVKNKGWDSVRQDLEKLARNAESAAMRAVLLTPVFMRDSGEYGANMVVNGDCEPNDVTAEALAAHNEVKMADWRDFKVKGWSTWNFQQTVTRFFLDTSEARSGGHSLAIGENNYSGLFQQGVRMQPGCRYRLSFWVKQSPANKGGAASIRWSGKGGWLDVAGGAPRISIPYPQESPSEWRRVATSFTAPSAAADPKRHVYALILLSAPKGQKSDEKINFDDIEITKIYDPAFFGDSVTVEKGDRFSVKLALDIGDPQIDSALEDLDEVLQASGLRKKAHGGLEWIISSVTNLPPATFELNIVPQRRAIEIVASDAEGIRCGIYTAIERFGIRWFIPGKPPVLASLPLELAAENTRIKPSSSYRGLHICGIKYHYERNVGDWMRRNRMNRKLSHPNSIDPMREELARVGIQPDTTVHSYSDWMPIDPYFETHPEWFALVGGKRISSGGQRCLANMDMRGEFAANAARYLDEHPEIAVIGICPNDGYGWCECDQCVALDTEDDIKNNTVNGRIADFVKDMCSRFAKTHPHILVGHYSYSNFADFPFLLDTIPDNLILSCTVFRCFRHTLDDPGCPINQPRFERLVEFSKKGVKNSYTYEYYVHNWGFLPAPFWRVAARDIQACRELGISGFLSEVSPSDRANWRSFHLPLYIVAQVLFDKDRDLEDILDDYCLRRFGSEAAPVMRTYMEVLEKMWYDAPGCANRQPTEFGEFFQDDGRGKCRELLERALSLAPKGEHRDAVADELQLFKEWEDVADRQAQYRAPKEIRPLPLDQLSLTAKPDKSKALVFTSRNTQVAPDTGKSRAWVYADEKSLGFLIECDEENMGDLIVHEGNTLKAAYGSDGIEIFLANHPDSPICYHIIANAGGGHAASEAEGKRWNWSWPGRYEVETRKMRRGWRMAFRIDKATIEVENGADFGFTLIRNRRAGGEWVITGVPDGGAFFAVPKYIIGADKAGE